MLPCSAEQEGSGRPEIQGALLETSRGDRPDSGLFNNLNVSISSAASFPFPDETRIPTRPHHPGEKSPSSPCCWKSTGTTPICSFPPPPTGSVPASAPALRKPLPPKDLRRVSSEGTGSTPPTTAAVPHAQRLWPSASPSRHCY